MFDMKLYLKNNLISGFQSGTFTAEQVAIYSGKFLIAGHFDETDVEEISRAIEPPALEK